MANKKPQIKLSVPSEAVVGEVIPIDPTGSIDPDGQIAGFSAGVRGMALGKVGIAFPAAGEYEIFGSIVDQRRGTDSATAIVTVREDGGGPPVGITISPATFPPMTVGAEVRFEVVATGGAGGFVYRVGSGAMPAGLTFAIDGKVRGTPTAGGPYAVELVATDHTGAAGVQAYTGTVAGGTAVGVVPTITVQPVPVTVEWGGLAVLELAAEGTAPISYQWFAGSAALPDATNPVLQYRPIASGRVWCRVSNAAGAVESATVTVEVRMPASPPATGVGLRYRRAIRVPSMWASYAYGDCTGRINARGNLQVIFSGDQVNQGSPIYEVEITDAPVASWAGVWDRPYGGKRGTWLQPAAMVADIDRLHGAISKLTRRDPGDLLEVARSLGSDVTIEKAANALAINVAMLKKADPDGAKAKSGEWAYLDYDNQTGGGYVPIVNGAHFFHPETGLLYVSYADTYNVTARPDCTLVALRLKEDGTTETFGPWRFKSRTNDGTIRYGDRAGGGPRPHPVTGDMLISAGMGSGNASLPWGANLSKGGRFPTDARPTDATLETNLECLDSYLYSWPMIGQFVGGVPTGPIRSMRRALWPAVGCAYEGQPNETYAAPAKNNGIGSWTDNDSQTGFWALPDRVIFGCSVAGSVIQDPTNPKAAHVWYATALNNPPYTCVHGIPSPVQITGPVSTARFPGLASYPWSVLEQVRRGEIPDYSPEPEWINCEAEWGVVTAEFWDIGAAKALACGPVRDGLVYAIAQHADTVSYPGIAMPLIHEFELVG